MQNEYQVIDEAVALAERLKSWSEIQQNELLGMLRDLQEFLDNTAKIMDEVIKESHGTTEK